MIRAAVIPALLALAACAGTPDLAAIDANAQRIAPRVARDCAFSGAVKLGNTIAGSAIPVPGAAIGAMALNAGIDGICADPEGVGRAIGAVEEEAKRLRD